MRHTTVSVICIVCFYALPATANNVKDPQAISVLTSCLDAAGGVAAISTISDFSAAGNITYNWEDQNVSGAVTLKGRGTTQFRVDADLAAGTRSWAVSYGTGTVVETDKTRITIPRYDAVNVGILSWRLPEIVSALTDPTVTISYIGLIKNGQGQAHQIHVQQTDPSNPDSKTANIKAVDYLIDANTYLLVETIDSNYSADDLTQPYQHVVLFSDYKAVNGVLVPFSIVEQMSGQSTWAAVLTSINFNVGLTDDDFKL